MATIWINFIQHGERQFAELGKYHNITHNNLVHLINKSSLINTVLEKKSINLYGPYKQPKSVI